MEDLDEFQAMLQDAYEQRKQELGVRRLSDSEFAGWLGVNSASFNMWVNKRRKPDQASAIILARRLGVRVFDVLGYDRVYEIPDPDLQRIVERWRGLDDKTKETVYSALGGDTRPVPGHAVHDSRKG